VCRGRGDNREPGFGERGTDIFCHELGFLRINSPFGIVLVTIANGGGDYCIDLMFIRHVLGLRPRSSSSMSRSNSYVFSEAVIPSGPGRAQLSLSISPRRHSSFWTAVTEFPTFSIAAPISSGITFQCLDQCFISRVSIWWRIGFSDFDSVIAFACPSKRCELSIGWSYKTRRGHTIWFHGNMSNVFRLWGRTEVAFRGRHVAS
jgi:hypothetical protein